MTVQANDSDAEKAHQKALKLIYRHTSRDYKGSLGGVKSILVCRNGATTLIPLDLLTEAEVAERLPSAMKKEAARVGKKAGARAVNSY